MSAMMRSGIPCICLAVLLLSGCVTRGDRHYKVWTDREAPGEGSRVAVVCGRADGTSQYYASALEERLRSHSRLRILGEAEVKARYPEYPVHIIRDAEHTDEQDDENLAKIGAALGADFVLAAWVVVYESSAPLSAFGTLELAVLARMISTKERRFVGVSCFVQRNAALMDRDHSAIAKYMLNGAADITARKMIDLMGVKAQ
jgi:hypothetical protein